MNVSSTGEVCPQCLAPAHADAPCPPTPVAPAASGFEAFDRPSVAGKGQGITSLSMGLQVGEYRVQERIGAGGMGVVYRAVQPATGKSVAIKVLSSLHARDASSVQRFILEIRAVNEVQHPHLVKIFSFGQLTDGRYYYVMEFLEGCSLGALMRARGQLQPAEVLPAFLDVLGALEVAHAKGIIHRDLKPDNVFLVDGRPSVNYRAKLLDFGLAKLVEPPPGMPALTAAGMAVGTPQYMAPEQCKARKVDGRADLYALGVMLYEALTGKLPCDGRSTLEIWEAHVRRVPRRPIELVPALSPELDSIIMTLLAKTPAERFSSAATAAAALAGEAGRLPATATDLPEAFSDGASASDVARAIPSSIQSADVIPLGGLAETNTAPARKLTDADGLRALLEPGLEVAEPALQTRNPNQVSALDIDLGVLRREEAPPQTAASSGRAPRVAQVARTERAGSGAFLKLALVLAGVIAAAVAVLLFAR
jgi:eukaryotic-like serine/threonine-protein kinase